MKINKYNLERKLNGYYIYTRDVKFNETKGCMTTTATKTYASFGAMKRELFEFEGLAIGDELDDVLRQEMYDKQVKDHMNRKSKGDDCE